VRALDARARKEERRMHRNGADERAALTARVDELTAAQALIRRRLATTWRPRLIELERDVDVILEVLIRGGDVAARLAEYQLECRRARVRAAEGDDDGSDDAA
jgi:hypothetical protein